MIDHNPYAIEEQTTDVAALDFDAVWSAAYGSADEQLRTIWVRLRDAWLRSKKGSEHTRRSYERASSDWMAFISGLRVNGQPLQLWQVTTEHVRLWQEQLAERLSASTVNQRLSACSSWYSFVINERGMVDGYEVSAFMDRSGKTRANPFAAATVARDKEVRYSKARVLSLAEILRLVDSLDNAVETFGKHKAEAARNRALLLGYLRTGYRSTELLRLRFRDIQPHKTAPGQWVVAWAGKGGKTKTKAFPASVVAAINSYVAIAGRHVTPDDFIFIRMRETPLTARAAKAADDAPLTQKSALCICKSALKRAGIDDWADIRVHDLRHTFAHRFRANNPDLEELRKHLNHSSLATTGIYAAAALDEPVDDWSEGLF